MRSQNAVIDEDWRVTEPNSSPDNGTSRCRIVDDPVRVAGGEKLARSSPAVGRSRSVGRSHMQWRPLGRLLPVLCAGVVALAALCPNPAIAEEPPLKVPAGGPLGGANGALNFSGWLFFPTAKVFSVFTDNLYQAPTNPVKVAGVGIAPSLVAEWSNGIHRTTLYGNAEVRGYTDDAANIYDRQAGIVQRYEAMRDLIFTVQADYTHRTNANSLNSSIPDALGTPGSIVLPNGDIQLPNGTIVNPAGQIVSGPTNQVANVAVGSTIFTNPNDQYTAMASVFKIFDRAFVRLTETVSRTDYENQSAINPNFSVRTFTGNGGFWFSPWLYAYSDGTQAVRSAPGLNSTAYRAVGGIGSAKIGLFSGAVYFGHQGSDVQNAGPAGGDVYGGRLSYYPTREWTWTLTADETVNKSSQISTSNLALNIGTQSPLLVPLGASTRTTAVNLQTDYAVSKQFSVTGRVGYTRVQFLNTTELEEAYLAYAALNYKVWRNMLLTLEYQYSQIVANVPLTSSTRNYLMLAATYKF